MGIPPLFLKAAMQGYGYLNSLLVFRYFDRPMKWIYTLISSIECCPFSAFLSRLYGVPHDSTDLKSQTIIWASESQEDVDSRSYAPTRVCRPPFSS